jgi:hypothetical protein
MPTNTRKATIVGISTFVAGAVYILLTCSLLGWGNGFRSSAEDPGKTFFHLVLFPIASATLMYRFPVDLVQAALKNKRILSLAILALGVLLMSAITWNDCVKRFTDYPTPADVADRSTRDELLKVQLAGRNSLSSSPANAEGDKAYVKVLNDKLPAPRSLRQASFRYYWGVFLTALAGIVLVALLWILLLYIVLRQQLHAGFAETVVMVICLLAPWLLLRTYSEWYIHFGNYRPGADQPFVIVAVFGLVVIYFTWLLQHGRPRVKIFAGGVAAVSTALGVIGKWKSEWLVNIARKLAIMDPVTLAGVYFFVSLVTVGTVWYSFSPRTEDTAAQPAPPQTNQPPTG